MQTQGEVSTQVEVAKEEPIESKLVSPFDIPDLTEKTRENLLKINSLASSFESGRNVSARRVYVFFDTQCVYCGQFWRESKKLNDEATFVWIPVRLLNSSSLSQGASILQASSPVELMDQNESLLSARKGGIKPASNLEEDNLKAVQQNSLVFQKAGAQAVPYILGINEVTGQVITHSGAVSAEKLSESLGWK